MRALLITFLLASPAFAEKPKPMVVPVAPLVPNPFAAPPTSRIVYMHRCGPGGCTINAGSPDNSRTNTSQIASANTTIGAFTQSDEVWKKMVLCVKATFAPFDIQITETDPGLNVEHYEHVVGGKPTQLDPQLTNAGGVASFRCGGIDNAMNFTFDVYGGDADTLCWTAAQEIAHGFGLEHELDPKDPLTYLEGYLPKRFQAAPAQCGEGVPRICACTGGMQSSYQHILDMFGPGTPTPPMVTIRAPSAGKTVQPKFVTRVSVIDDSGIDHVELIIDGSKVTESYMDPYTMVAPADAIPEGPHQMEVRAYDVAGAPASAMIDITMGPPCTASKGCTDPDVCVAGVCLPGPDAPGGLGYDCTASSECISRNCVKDEGSSVGHCVEACDPSVEGVCPNGFECLPGGSSGVCWPTASGGCCDAGGSPGGPLMLTFGVLVIVLRPRRGARRSSARGGGGWGWCARDRASTEPQGRG